MSVTRQFVFSIDPEQGLASTFSWSTVADSNTSGNAYTCAYAPPRKGTAISLYQETAFLGTINAGETLQIFRDDLAQDDGASFTAQAITGRIDPTKGQDGVMTQKRFTNVFFRSVNPLENSTTVEVTLNELTPHKGGVTWTELDHTSGSEQGGIPSGTAKWVNFRFTDSSDSLRKEVLSAFQVEYYVVR